VNPWAVVVFALGVILIIIGVKGSQHNIAAALTNKAPKASAAPTVPAKSGGTIS